MIMLMIPKNMTIQSKRIFLIQIYEMLFTKLNMNDRIDAVSSMINQAPEHQIDIEIDTLQNGSFQKVVSAMISCELTDGEIDHIRALYEGIFRPYIQHGGQIPKVDLEWAYNQIFQFTELIHKRRLAEEKKQLKASRKRLYARRE